jgi:hypothetical protein
LSAAKTATRTAALATAETVSATAETIASAKPVATAAETVLTTAFREWIEAVFAETVPLVAPPAATSSVKTHET